MPNLCPVRLDDCVGTVLENASLPDDIELQVDCPATTPAVLADPNQLIIVLGNLIRNARDAMSDGGRLTILACRGEDRIELSVTDTGTGIPPDQLNRIMEPLFSTKARGMCVSKK